MTVPQHILVIDAGTGGCRAVVFDTKGETIARAYRGWVYFAPEGLELYGKEFNPDEFWGLILDCIREVLTSVNSASLVAVTSSSQRQGCLFLDKDGNALYGGPNIDVRGMAYAMEIEEAVGEERAFNLTGHWPSWMTMAARLFWFRQDKPEIFERMAKAVMINDWILYKLCGNFASEPTNVGETLLMDIHTRQWSDALIQDLKFERNILADIVQPGTAIGRVSAGAAGQTGLPRDVPVVVGGADSQAALYAVGVNNPGDVGVIAGTTAPVMMALDQGFLDAERKLWTCCHVLPDRWLLESNCGDTGKIFRWYVEEHIGAFAEYPYDIALQKAAEIPAGSEGLFTHLGPMIWNLREISPSKKAGLLTSYPLEQQRSTIGHFVRAILENIAYGIKGNLEQIVSSCGKEPVSITLCGGMTRAELFNRILVATLNKPIKVSSCKEATALGAAMAAAVGAGIYKDLIQAGASMAQELETMEPDPDWAEEYDSSYGIWRDQYNIMENGF